MGGMGVILRYGSCTIDWNTFITGLGTIHRYLWASKTAALNHEWRLQGHPEDNWWNFQPLHRVWKDLRPMNEAEEEGKNRFSFEQLLEVSAQSVTSDDRDLVYGLVGLMESSLADNIQLDYSLDTRSVFASVAKTEIETSSSLEILRHCNPWGRVGSPTWVPDWTWGRPREFTLNRRFNASKGLKMEVSFVGWSGLKCKGIILDKIDGFMARRIAGNESGGEYRLNSGKFPKHPKSAYGDSKATRTALGCAFAAATENPEDPKHEAVFHLPRTFDLGLPQFKERGWEKFVENGEFYFRWADWIRTNGSFPIGDQTLEEFFNPYDKIPSGASYEHCWEAYQKFIHVIIGRRFAVSSKGYIGWVPESMYRGDDQQTKVGDLYCIIFGCSMPVILRECGGYYQVIGEGYLQGFMEGRAVELLEIGEYEAENFIIR
jgi:hypothetical protein